MNTDWPIFDFEFEGKKFGQVGQILVKMLYQSMVLINLIKHIKSISALKPSNFTKFVICATLAQIWKHQLMMLSNLGCVAYLKSPKIVLTSMTKLGQFWTSTTTEDYSLVKVQNGPSLAFEHFLKKGSSGIRWLDSGLLYWTIQNTAKRRICISICILCIFSILEHP